MQQRVLDRFSLEKLSEHSIYTRTDALRSDYPWCKVKNHWHSIDAHYHYGAGNVALFLFPVRAANTLIMHSNDQIASEWPDLQDQKSWKLSWRSYSEWARARVALCSAWTASQYPIPEWPQPITTQSTNDARPKLIDAPLTLILPCAYPEYVIIQFGLIYR